MNRGDLEGAQSLFEEAVAEDPENYEAWFYIGEIFYRLRKFQEAEDSFKKALRIVPALQAVRYRLAKIAEEKGRFDQAYTYYREEIEKTLLGNPWAKTAEQQLRSFGETQELFVSSHEHLAEANRLLDKGNREGAESELRRVLQIAPQNTQALYLQGRLYIQSKKIPQAVEALERYAQIVPTAVSVLLQLAILYEEQDNFEKAIATYKTIIARGEGTPEANTARKKLAIMGEDPVLARKGFELFEKGITVLEEGKLEEAFEIFQDLLDFLPGNSEAHMAVAGIYQRQGKDDKAINEYKKIHAVDPKHYPSRYALGFLYTLRGLFDKAKEEFRYVVELAKEERLVEKAKKVLASIALEEERIQISKEARSHYNRAIKLSQDKQFAKAIQEIQEAIRIQPENHFFHFNLGIVYINNNQLHEGTSSFLKAVELEPDYLPAHFRLGLILRLTKQYRLALKEFEKVVSLGKEEKFQIEEAKNQIVELKKRIGEEQAVLGHSILGGVFLTRADFVQAREIFETSLLLAPDIAQSHFLVGYIEELEGKLEFAKASYYDALRIDPTLSPVYFRLAFVLRLEGDLDKAIKAYHKALELNPRLLLVHSELGDIFQQKGLSLPAKEQYRLFLERSPQGYSPEKALVQGKLDFYEKRYRLNFSFNPISFDSNLGSRAAPNPDYFTGFSATLRYYTYRTKRFSLPIVFSTSNTVYVRSQVSFSTNTISPRFELTHSDYLLAFAYRYLYIHDRIGPSARRQQVEGSVTWNPFSQVFNLPGITWRDFFPTSVSMYYSYQHSYSFRNPLLDANRNYTSFSIGKNFSTYGSMHLSYSYSDNRIANPGQNNASQSWRFSYTKPFSQRGRLRLSYGQSITEFKVPDVFFRQNRKNRSSSPSVTIVMDITPNFQYILNVTHRVNRSNLPSRRDPATVTALLSGQAVPLGSFRKALITNTFLFNF